MLNTMITLSSDLDGDCREVLVQINAMAGKIYKTMSNIGGMVLQIDNMGTRIVQTASILSQLGKQCHVV